MYKLTVRIADRIKNKEEIKAFRLSNVDSADFHDQMNEIADYLYDLDIPFAVDEDGDMMIDDILMSLSEGEAFAQTIAAGKKTYMIEGAAC